MRCLLLSLFLAAFVFPGQSQGQAPDGLPPEDWNSIRAAHGAARFHAMECEKGMLAYNPGQRWWATFDGQGFLVEPKGGAWSWGLQLESIGFAGAMVEVKPGAVACADGNRIWYDWSEDLQEWYINDTRGLEHGYTLERRPSKGTASPAPLVLEMTVRGPLSAQVIPGGMGVCFLDADGARRVTYSGLKVFDADGVPQSVRFEVEGPQIRIVIDESHARYPLTIDPVAQQAYLKASNTDAEDRFGHSIAVSGDLVVVGAMYEASHATGVNGDQSDNSAPISGAAYVYRRTGGVWSQEAYLKASNTEAGDQFGSAVAVSGNLIAVAAENEQSQASGLNGDQSDNSLNSSGAVYLFEFAGGTWTQIEYIKASNTGNLDLFGRSLAFSGGVLVVGAPGEGSGVHGDQSDNSARSSGAVYVFYESAGVWGQHAYLKASTCELGDSLGHSVGMSGSSIIAGAPGEDSDGTGANGGQGNNSMPQSGAAIVFTTSVGVWTQRAYLKSFNPGSQDRFGGSVAISGERAVVGAREEQSQAVGVDGDPQDNSVRFAGAAYVFERVAGVWSQEAYLKASNTVETGFFGDSIAMLGDRILVGSPGEHSLTSGIDGNPERRGIFSSGAAYLFERSTGVWKQEAFIKSANSDLDDQFGHSVAMDGDLAVVGAWHENSTTTGVNGDGSINSIFRAGAAYVLDLEASVANFCGVGQVNSAGTSASLSHTGSLAVADNDLALHALGLPLNQFGYFLNSAGRSFVAYPGGSQGHLCLGGSASLGRHNRSFEIGFSGLSGVIDLQLDLTSIPTPLGPIQVMAGETWHFQCWYRDVSPSSSSNFSDGLTVRFE